MKCARIILLLLFLLPLRAWSDSAPTQLRSSPTYTGTTVPLVLSIGQYDEYNVTLTANTPITFSLPVTSSTIVFRINLCQNATGNFTAQAQGGDAIDIITAPHSHVSNIILSGSRMGLNVQNGSFEVQVDDFQTQAVVPGLAPLGFTNGSGIFKINGASLSCGWACFITSGASGSLLHIYTVPYSGTVWGFIFDNLQSGFGAFDCYDCSADVENGGTVGLRLRGFRQDCNDCCRRWGAQ